MKCENIYSSAFRSHSCALDDGECTLIEFTKRTPPGGRCKREESERKKDNKNQSSVFGVGIESKEKRGKNRRTFGGAPIRIEHKSANLTEKKKRKKRKLNGKKGEENKIGQARVHKVIRRKSLANQQQSHSYLWRVTVFILALTELVYETSEERY